MDDVDEEINRTIDGQHQVTDINDSLNSLGRHAPISTLWTNDNLVQIRNDFAALANHKDQNDHN